MILLLLKHSSSTIFIFNNKIASVWNYYDSSFYRAFLWPNCLTSLEYSNLTFPFEFSDTIWNKIKYRFKQLEVGKLIKINFLLSYPLLIITRRPNNNDSGLYKNKDWLINQVKLLYYAFKYFKNDITHFHSELQI